MNKLLNARILVLSIFIIFGLSSPGWAAGDTTPPAAPKALRAR